MLPGDINTPELNLNRRSHRILLSRRIGARVTPKMCGSIASPKDLGRRGFEHAHEICHVALKPLVGAAEHHYTILQ